MDDLAPVAGGWRDLEDRVQQRTSTVISPGADEYKRRWSSRLVPSPRTFVFAPNLRGSSARFMRFQAAPLWRWLRLSEP